MGGKQGKLGLIPGGAARHMAQAGQQGGFLFALLLIKGQLPIQKLAPVDHGRQLLQRAAVAVFFGHTVQQMLGVGGHDALCRKQNAFGAAQAHQRRGSRIFAAPQVNQIRLCVLQQRAEFFAAAGGQNSIIHRVDG